jgi:asparagine N-glycosylation enzyme membrane subunit Stt3
MFSIKKLTIFESKTRLMENIFNYKNICKFIIATSFTISIIIISLFVMQLMGFQPIDFEKILLVIVSASLGVVIGVFLKKIFKTL